MKAEVGEKVRIRMREKNEVKVKNKDKDRQLVKVSFFLFSLAFQDEKDELSLHRNKRCRSLERESEICNGVRCCV